MFLLPFHITGGLLGLVTGAVALYARKGGTWHRRSGMIFVYAMLVMSATGAVLAVIQPEGTSIIAGLLTFYMVATAYLTVRRRTRARLLIDLVAMLFALGVGLASWMIGIAGAISSSDEGVPPVMAFIFGAVALLAALGDGRMIVLGGLKGSQRLARHLWRMCFALWVAASSFFLGQADIFPRPLRIYPLLALPMLVVLLLMVFWLVRVSFTRWQPGVNNELRRSSQ